ncbi:MAG: ribosome silencing factor, partial [Planctomyces sp.]
AVPGPAGAAGGPAGGPAGASPAAAEVAAEESEAAVPKSRGAEVAGGRVVLPQSAAKSSARSASAVAVGSDLPEAAPVQRRPAFWRAAKPQPGRVAQPQAATGRARL